MIYVFKPDADRMLRLHVLIEFLLSNANHFDAYCSHNISDVFDYHGMAIMNVMSFTSPK